MASGDGRTIDVSSDGALTAALAVAGPGDTIRLAPGRYAPIVITSAGTAGAPITLSGPDSAVLAGGGSGYVVHLDGARYWQLTGFTSTARASTSGAPRATGAISGENYADSVVDIKGYDSRVVDNVTTGNSPNLKNIIETHVITSPATSGCGNTIEGNTVEGFTPSGQLVSVDKKCG